MSISIRVEQDTDVCAVYDGSGWSVTFTKRTPAMVWAYDPYPNDLIVHNITGETVNASSMGSIESSVESAVESSVGPQSLRPRRSRSSPPTTRPSRNWADDDEDEEESIIHETPTPREQVTPEIPMLTPHSQSGHYADERMEQMTNIEADETPVDEEVFPPLEFLWEDLANVKRYVRYPYTRLTHGNERSASFVFLHKGHPTAITMPMSELEKNRVTIDGVTYASSDFHVKRNGIFIMSSIIQ